MISTHQIPATSLQVGMTIADPNAYITQVGSLGGTVRVHTNTGEVIDLNPSDMVEVVEDTPAPTYTTGTYNPTYRLRKS